jgi:hypothetical protein
MSSKASVLVLPVACALFVVAVYFPDVGRGFIKDDFTWIRTAQAAAANPVRLVRQPDPGFYRPLVSLTFIYDYAVHGWKARGYGWTNLALCVACAFAVAALALAIGLSRRAALLAGALWLINPHGVNMAILWLSGRTATLLTLCSLLAAVAFLRRWHAAAAALIALALLAKEEAVMLPFILLSWSWIRERGARPRWTAIAALFGPLAVYLSLRALTPAMTPATAPSFYRFTVDPLSVMRNLGEYLDRTATLAAAALVCAMIAYRARPRTTAAHRPLLAMLAVWWAGMFAITIWLPVRSSLYAVCPSAAAAMAGALLIDRTRAVAARSPFRFELVLAILLVAAIPIYQMRDDLRVEAARVSQRTLNAIDRDLPSLPRTGVVVLHEDPDAAVFREAFGDLPAEALRTRFGRDWDARIVESPAASRGTADGNGVIAEYWIRHGTLTGGPSR